MNRLIRQRTERQLAHEHGMPLTYYAILVALSEAPERKLRMNDLAVAVDGSPSQLSHAVKRLEERGWIRRTACTSDARGFHAHLTDDGLEALQKAAPGHVAQVRRVLFDALTDEQVEQLGQIAQQVVAHDSCADQRPA